MQHSTRVRPAIVSVVAALLVAACGRSKAEESAAGNVATPSSTQPSAIAPAPYSAPRAGADSSRPKHHSKLKGAAAGAAAGHHASHSAAGADTAAAIQHERNKHKK